MKYQYSASFAVVAVISLLKVHVIILLTTVVVVTSAATLIYFLRRPTPVYLVDYACFKPHHTRRVPHSSFVEHARLHPNLDGKATEFMTRILERSGLGQDTCLPDNFHYIPPTNDHEASLSETRLVIFSSIDDLLRNTRVHPRDIGILVVNCSVFSPIPSLSAMIINRYDLPCDVRSFNLSGMGCSAGPIAIGLAGDLLKLSPTETYALVVSTEITTSTIYTGDERAMLVPNCLFRMGSSAVLLSNRPGDHRRSKYRHLHIVRTAIAANDCAYRCIHYQEDHRGMLGISLSKDLVSVAGEAVKVNVTAAAPLVLPASEKFRFIFALIGSKIFNLMNIDNYIPDFKKAAKHFCIHAGGRPVIEALEKGLQLSAEHTEASRMTLHRFGNTSSSSLWYELSYIEAKGRMRRGDHVWMIGLGSGFKCNTAFLVCLRDIATPVDDGPWSGCIDQYPVKIMDVVKV